jgi:type III restriction enzyme
VFSRFIPNLQRDLSLAYKPEHWDKLRIATWLCRNLPEPSLTHASKQAFVVAWTAHLLQREVTLVRVNLQSFLLRDLIESRIRELRKQAVTKAYQELIFGGAAASRVVVNDKYAFDFPNQGYALWSARSSVPLDESR